MLDEARPVSVGQEKKSELNGEMLGLQGSRGDFMHRLRTTGLHVAFYYDLRREDALDEGILRQLHRKKDASLGRPPKIAPRD